MNKVNTVWCPANRFVLPSAAMQIVVGSQLCRSTTVLFLLCQAPLKRYNLMTNGKMPHRFFIHRIYTRHRFVSDSRIGMEHYQECGYCMCRTWNKPHLKETLPWWEECTIVWAKCCSFEMCRRFSRVKSFSHVEGCYDLCIRARANFARIHIPANIWHERVGNVYTP